MGSRTGTVRTLTASEKLHGVAGNVPEESNIAPALSLSSSTEAAPGAGRPGIPQDGCPGKFPWPGPVSPRSCCHLPASSGILSASLPGQDRPRVEKGPGSARFLRHVL